MENIFRNNTKFDKVNVKTRTLNFQVNHEKRINEIIKSLKSAGSLSDKKYKKTKAVGSRPGVLYSLCKVDKSIVDFCRTFRPTLSTIGTPTYKIAKFLAPILTYLSINEFTVKDFHLQKKTF